MLFYILLSTFVLFSKDFNKSDYFDKNFKTCSSPFFFKKSEILKRCGNKIVSEKFKLKTQPIYWGASEENADNSAYINRMIAHCSIFHCRIDWVHNYKIRNSIFLKSYIEINGRGEGSLIQNFSKKGLLMVTNKPNIPLNDVYIHNMKFDRRGRFGEHGVILSNVDNLVFYSNFFVGNKNTEGGALGISPFDKFAEKTSKRIFITKNSFEFTGNFGVQLGNTIDWVVRDNLFYNCYRECVGIEPYSLGLKKGSLVDNDTFVNKELLTSNSYNYKKIYIYGDDISPKGPFMVKSYYDTDLFSLSKSFSGEIKNRNNIKYFELGVNHSGLIYNNRVFNDRFLIRNGSSTGAFILTESSLGVVDDIIVEKNSFLNKGSNLSSISYAIYGCHDVRLYDNISVNAVVNAYSITEAVVNGLKITPKPPLRLLSGNIFLKGNKAIDYGKVGIYISKTDQVTLTKNLIYSKKSKIRIKKM